MTFNPTHFHPSPSYPFYRYATEAARILLIPIGMLKAFEPDDHIDALSNDQKTVYRLSNEVMFQKTVDNFQTYVVDIIAEILAEKPEMIPSGEIDRKIIFSERSMGQIKVEIIEKLLRQYGYMGLSKLSEKLDRQFSFKLIDSIKDVGAVEKYVNVRNLIVHNRGLVDYRYRANFSDGERSAGTEVEIPDPLACLSELSRIASSIDKTALEKFKLERVPSASA